MPKILNLTNEEKADRYDKKFKKHHLTIEEKVGLWDAHRSRCLGYCRKYSTEHPDRIALTGAEYYEKNKIELNKKSVIRILKNRELKKAST